VIYGVVVALSITLGPAPSGDLPYLTTLANHPALSRADFIVFSVSDLLLVPGAFALYHALGRSAKKLVLVAGVLLAAFVVIDLAVTEYNSLVLVQLAQNYAGATSDTQRATAIAEAAAARGALPIGTMLSYIVSSVGFLLAAIATFRGVFRRAIGVVGIIGSVEGILGGFYVLSPGFAAFLLPSLVTVGLWAVAVGIRLYRLGWLESSVGETPTHAGKVSPLKPSSA